ncbi:MULTISPECIES: type II secretion system minor pseudopilin GspK [unclassified Polaromonas]|uniref:type II secretion system minor pseudopilin GspK n=1 Tax=unclassified Polaromonas TaxID=2638319 RepID=UPI000F07561C|nr:MULTISPECIES: type II secretion system minor pseudopilin GspK [unclassified Polaromonas]AYQ30279.1 general secretion pathway protein GspK [Polaromonas sp. SP1]QGJ18603.1 general secretion pathway protein GspK [Polaromonas sp. Pch-P]
MTSHSVLTARRHAGAALLAAMLTMTLVATFAAAALWQQFRGIEVEGAERIRVQSGWILTGALDWARLILRQDAQSGETDHLAEPWATPMNEARLSSFLAADNTISDTDNQRDAFLSSQVSDLQARLNVTNLIDDSALSESGLQSFARLFDLLGLPAEQLSKLSGQMLKASRAAAGPSDAASSTQIPIIPQRVEQLVWLGLSPDVLSVLSPYITLLPQRTPVNLNTASAEVIYAITPDLQLVDAQKLVAARARSHFRDLSEASQQIGGAVQFDDGRHSVASRFFEVRERLKLDQVIVPERSLLQRDGLSIRTLWRDRGAVADVVLPVSGNAPRS